MTRHDVLRHLLGREPRGTGPWNVRCPAHDDRRPSLSVRVKAGKVLLRCHAGAGCSEKDICSAAGIRVADLFLNGASAPLARSRSRVVARYPYRDESGALLFEVQRLDPKGFRQRRPDGRGGWLWNLADVRRIPYRLPKMLAAPERTVFVVEGEKDADALAEIGFLATTNPGGAEKWKRLDTAAVQAAFRGRRAVIIPDADEPGRRHARDVARHLRDIAMVVRILELPPPGANPTAKCKDVSDWLAAGGTAEELKALARQALKAPESPEPAGAPDSGVAEIGAEETGGPAPVLQCLADVEPQELRWLWPGRIPLGKLTLVAGLEGLGKSALTLDIAARVSTGRGWPDRPGEPAEPRRVLLLSAEDDPGDTIRPRLDAAGADVKRINLLKAVRRRDGETGTARETPFDLALDLPALQRAIADSGNTALVIIDPITAYLGKTDGNDNSALRGLLAPLAEIAGRHSVAILAVTHLRKAAGRALNSVIGSRAFTAAPRAAWLVAKDPHDPAGDRRVFVPLKANLAPKDGGGGLAFTVINSMNGRPVISWSQDAYSAHRK